jgi:hypothetical protein
VVNLLTIHPVEEIVIWLICEPQMMLILANTSLGQQWLNFHETVLNLIMDTYV